jgi:hypothetical protein
MIRLVSKRRVVHSVAMICLGYVLASTTNASFGDPAPTETRTGLDAKYLRLPMGPEVSSGCGVEEYSYNTAVEKYLEAEQAVIDTYDDWVSCDMGNMTPTVSADPGTQSVLTR